ncbi:hypothetical protein YW3DRAFT_06517 [Streptomyces sp. MnatMP-M77]|uniref:hypothetical protein n=1 Tax=unclassified Streptomyces TaxID=2593676 RepID=UPI00080489FE|nr:hypothetical protein [Streptomyces sp. MnatMP-M77]MYT77526.1 hypothetical protein [Streptomyces sp. SID8364]SBU99337.1 hypothetical protein YW3DRAFT_06517 [Streptomyces sp. MnatMP-M77]
MPADLYTRYIGATDRWAEHAADCGACTTTEPGCPDGIPLWERYCRLQDAYLNHLRETRGTS